MDVAAENLAVGIGNQSTSFALFAFRSRPVALPNIAPADAAMIQCISGSTGFHMGALLRHRGPFDHARIYATRRGVAGTTTRINVMAVHQTSDCAMSTLRCISFRLADGIDQFQAHHAGAILGVPTLRIKVRSTQDVCVRAPDEAAGGPAPFFAA